MWILFIRIHISFHYMFKYIHCTLHSIFFFFFTVFEWCNAACQPLDGGQGLFFSKLPKFHHWKLKIWPVWSWILTQCLKIFLIIRITLHTNKTIWYKLFRIQRNSMFQWPPAAKGRAGTQPKNPQWAFVVREGNDIPFGSVQHDVASVACVTQVEGN